MAGFVARGRDSTRSEDGDPKAPYDVYIGRARAGQPEIPWGNPFSHRPGCRAQFTAPKDDVLTCYQDWLQSQSELVERARGSCEGRCSAASAGPPRASRGG